MKPKHDKVSRKQFHNTLFIAIQLHATALAVPIPAATPNFTAVPISLATLRLFQALKIMAAIVTLVCRRLHFISQLFKVVTYIMISICICTKYATYNRNMTDKFNSTQLRFNDVTLELTRFNFPIFFFIRILGPIWRQFVGGHCSQFHICFCSYFLLIHNAAVCSNKSCVKHNGTVHVHSLFVGFAPVQILLCFLWRKTSDKCLVSHFSKNLQLALARERSQEDYFKMFLCTNQEKMINAINKKSNCSFIKQR